MSAKSELIVSGIQCTFINEVRAFQRHTLRLVAALTECGSVVKE